MSLEGAFKEIVSKDDFDVLLKQKNDNVLVIHFSANWAAQCKQIQEVLLEMKKKLQQNSVYGVEFVEVQAEKFPEISKKFNVEAVPTCIIIKNSKEIARINGVNTLELVKKIEEFSSSLKPKQNLNERLKSLINQSEVMVFMKGSPEAPKCGFSKTLVQLLNEQKVQFKSFDILTDEEVRQGLKEYSNWPTYPQVYVKGELVGGLDIIKELISNGEFAGMLPSKQSLDDQIKALINKEEVMLFMKGSPDSVKCGFSRSIIQILNSKNKKYGHFDILTNNEIREGLKVYSNWPTYPQLYVKGELIGGLDIVNEMNQNGDLDKLFSSL